MQKSDRRIGFALLLLCLLMALLPAAALAENSDSVTEYTIEGYSSEYDGQPHSITLNLKQGDLTVKYSKDGGVSWQNENPGFKDVGSYTVHVQILKGGKELAATDSATVTITKGTPQLYFKLATSYSSRAKKAASWTMYTPATASCTSPPATPSTSGWTPQGAGYLSTRRAAYPSGLPPRKPTTGKA